MLQYARRFEDTLCHVYGRLRAQRERDRIAVGPDRRTSLPDVWAGGDCVAISEDLTVAAVQDGKLAAEAIDALMSSVPDILISDIGMPGEDGYAFARRLRTFPRERGGVTPIVALTAYASARDRRQAIEAGYDYHLPKPVDTEELIRVLDRLAREPSARA